MAAIDAKCLDGLGHAQKVWWSDADVLAPAPGQAYLRRATAGWCRMLCKRILSQQLARSMLMAEHDYDLPDARGHFGQYGGVFVAETLIAALDELKEAYAAAQRDPQIRRRIRYDLKHYVGRPSPIYHAGAGRRLLGGAQIYLKREDLNHTGAHKINNCIGQALLARRMGKPRVIAETGAGQHGVATATVAARYGMECVVYMGAEDIQRQAANVYRMKLLGATVVPVESGSRTLKDA
jgi:tryptophan synthase beta chain